MAFRPSFNETRYVWVNRNGITESLRRRTATGSAQIHSSDLSRYNNVITNSNAVYFTTREAVYRYRF